MTTRTAPAPTARPCVSERIARTLGMLEKEVPVVRRLVRSGDTVYQAGERLDHLYIINSGFFKTVNVSVDGREQVVGLHFKGDWLGFDGIAEGAFVCDAIAMDTGEVWAVRYDALLAACARAPALMASVHAAMSREIGRDRDSMLALCTLPADARVADFLRHWADSMAQCGLRTDQITLRMTRSEIGNYLGMKLETVSRALSRLERDKVIGFSEKGRRDVYIPDVGALSQFVARSLAPASTTLQ